MRTQHLRPPHVNEGDAIPSRRPHLTVVPKEGQILQMIDGKPTWVSPRSWRTVARAVGWGALHGGLIVLAGSLVVAVVLLCTLVLSW